MSRTQCFQSYGNPSLSDWSGSLRTLGSTCQCQSSVEGRQVLDSLLQQSRPMLAPSQSAVLVKCVRVQVSWQHSLMVFAVAQVPLLRSSSIPLFSIPQSQTTHVPSYPNLSLVSPKLNRCPCICATAIMVLVGGMVSCMGVTKTEDTPLEPGGGLEETLAEVTADGRFWRSLDLSECPAPYTCKLTGNTPPK